MSYRAGVGSVLAARIGMEPGPPRFICDMAGCSAWVEVKGRGMGSIPPAWFLADKAPPRWRRVRNADGTVSDLCPVHQPSPPPEQPGGKP